MSDGLEQVTDSAAGRLGHRESPFATVCITSLDIVACGRSIASPTIIVEGPATMDNPVPRQAVQMVYLAKMANLLRI